MCSGGQREKEQERDNVREGLRKDQVAREIHSSAKGIFLRGERELNLAQAGGTVVL